MGYLGSKTACQREGKEGKGGVGEEDWEGIQTQKGGRIPASGKKKEKNAPMKGRGDRTAEVWA